MIDWRRLDYGSSLVDYRCKRLVRLLFDQPFAVELLDWKGLL
ncbi:MAG: hypothetical protein RL240_306 [Planctomycetota bacterium]|jgi:hypothetical protein